MSSKRILKRSLDITLSSAGLVLSSPVWAVISVAIILDDGLPVFYRQKRVGKNGEHFTAYKFRTMVKDSDELYGPLQATSNDKRILRTGKVLRKSAMDELPQLLSILKGDMSFVGPRALLPSEIESNGNIESAPESLEDIPGYHERHSVKPGLTGIAQIYASRDVPRRKKFRYDKLYIKNHSILLDVKLILHSFLISFTGGWERRGKSIEK